MENQTDLYQELKEAGCEMANHESDLYVKATMTSFEIIKKYGIKLDGIQASKFCHQVTGQRWFDIPFAFTPWWDKRLKSNRKYLIHTSCQKILVKNCNTEETALIRAGIHRGEALKIESVVA